MKYLLGGAGTLGKAILRNLDFNNVRVIYRNEYLKWISLNQIHSFIEYNKINSSDILYICFGVTDPQYNRETLELINFQIPMNILKATHLTEAKIITFGSINETFQTTNLYLQSKRKLYDYINSTNACTNHKHVQLHTIYGINMPKKYMFLGQIENALRLKANLKMTSGTQLREYWHAEDVAQIIVDDNLINTFGRIEKISSGQPFQIKNLAIAIFNHFHALDRLEIGGIEDSPYENYNYAMVPRIPELAKFKREEFSGVIKYLEDCLGNKLEK